MRIAVHGLAAHQRVETHFSMEQFVRCTESTFSPGSDNEEAE